MSTAQENSVAERNAAADAERRAELVAALRAMGLDGYPELVEGQLWKYPEKCILCDIQGKAILCVNGWSDHIATAMSGLLGREVECMPLNNGGRIVHVFKTGANLSIPERHALATMNRYFDEYRPGFHAKDGDVNLPHALHALAAPVNFVDEADAYQLAAAIKEAFPDYDADVIATDEGYAVVVHDENGDLNGWGAERIAAIAGVVSCFNLTPKQKGRHAIEAGAEEGYSEVPWQIRLAERHTQQQRLEDGINAILAHLGHPGVVGQDNTSPTNTKRGKGVAALIPPNPALEAKLPALTVSVHDDLAAKVLAKTTKKTAVKKSSAKRSA